MGASGSSWDYRQQGADWTGVCATGTRQSPIDIVADTAEAAGKDDVLRYNFVGDPPQFIIENNGHTLMVKADGDTQHELVINGKEKFSVAQFHFHTLSEHTFDGAPRHLEVHIVHTSQDSNDDSLVVVGMTFKAASDVKPNVFLQDLIAVGVPEPQTSSTKGCSDLGSTCLHLKHLFPSSSTVNLVRYEGSLTTPPCSEVVTWFVALNPISVPLAQIKHFVDAFAYEGTNGNYRIVDPSKNPGAALTRVAFETHYPSSSNKLRGVGAFYVCTAAIGVLFSLVTAH